MANTIGVLAPEGLAGEALLDRLAESSVPADQVRALEHAPDPAARVDYGSTRLAVDSLDTVDFGALRGLLVPEPVCRYPEAIRGAVEADCPVAGIEPQQPFEVASAGDGLTLVPPAPMLIVERLIRAAMSLGAIAGVDAVALDPASAGGQSSVERLARECAEVLNARTPEPPSGDVVRAFNAVGSAGDSRAILDVPVRLTRVAMPVFFGQGVVGHLAFRDPVDPESLRRALGADHGMNVHGPAPVTGARDGIDSDGLDVTVFSETLSDVQRVWVVGDNLRLQAAELMAGVTA